jgi:hypothetical protein
LLYDHILNNSGGGDTPVFSFLTRGDRHDSLDFAGVKVELGQLQLR